MSAETLADPDVVIEAAGRPDAALAAGNDGPARKSIVQT
jgi:hypothetical protein